MKKIILVLVLVMCFVADADLETGHSEFNSEKTYENEDLSLGFDLPEGYKFESEEVLLDNNKKLASILDEAPFDASISMAVMPNEDTSLYSVVVFEFQSRAKVNADYVKKFGNGFALLMAKSKGSSDIIQGERTIYFCEQEVLCEETSYVIDGNTEYLLCYTGTLNNRHICVFSWGTSEEAAAKLMECFYKVAD